MSRNQVRNQVGYKSNKFFSFSKQESTFHSLPIAIILFVCWTYSYPEVGTLITKVNVRWIDGTSGYFRLNSGCSVEQKILRIPLWTLPRKRKQLGIPFRGTEIEAKCSFPNPSRNSLLNPSTEEKTTRNSVLNHSAAEKTTLNKTRQRQSPTVV
jgi:hypothetical protein